MILHSLKDDVIPFADSEEIINNSGLPPETLIEVGSDHRLADEESLSVMLWVCNPLASGEKLSWLDDEQQSAAASSSNDKSTSQEDASYICDACGEEIVIPLDLTEDSSQSDVEDCPVYCAIASTPIDDLYDYKEGKVFFKPTLAFGKNSFRPTKQGALSYFLGGDEEFPEDTGFALKHWVKVRYDTMQPRTAFKSTAISPSRWGMST